MVGGLTNHKHHDRRTKKGLDSLLLTSLLFLLNVCDCSEFNYNYQLPSQSPAFESPPPTLSFNGSNETSFDILMPGVRPKEHDDYYCAVKRVPAETLYIKEFEPKSTADRAHHMLLFACDDVDEKLVKGEWWDCGHHYRACNNMRIIFAWAKNAPRSRLPDDVGYRIGEESNVKYLVLQVHYAHPLEAPLKDVSGFGIHVSREEPKYLQGIMILLRSELTIPPEREKIHGDMNCMLQSPSEIHPFAYRVHTHKLGEVVSGYKINHKDGVFTEIGKGNPQWPQAFYPVQKPLTIKPGDLVAARCTFTTLGFPNTTQIGQTSDDEMCNFYIMFYTRSRDPEDHFIQCVDEISKDITPHLPYDSDIPLPRNLLLEEHAKGHGTVVKKPSAEYPSPSKRVNHTKKRPGFEGKNIDIPYVGSDSGYNPEEDRGFKGDPLPLLYHVVGGWPNRKVTLGQASGVDLDPEGNVVAFHRGDRIWKADTFNVQNVYNHRDLGPIPQDTVYVITPNTGVILHTWGKNLFYMPHDITVAENGDTFLTDVALHQVFKFVPGSDSPSLVLGEAFVPGNDDKHFCKPAAVAVMKNGDFFVADGYCNTRILKFNALGEKLLEWGRSFQPSLAHRLFGTAPPPPNSFSVPHALALSEDKDLLCVADRQNGRIQCFRASDGNFQFLISSPLFGGRLYSVSYSDLNGGTLFAINGPNEEYQTVQGFVIPLATRAISGTFAPSRRGFALPHDIKVTRNGSALFVVEIAQPYKIWKFDAGPPEPLRTGKGSEEVVHDKKEPGRRVEEPKVPPSSGKKEKGEEKEDLSASIIIMAFLTIPILLFIGVGALLRLRSNGCCSRKRKESKSFQEFFPPSAGFEKLRMDESESENSDTEVEEFAVSSFRKPSV